MAPQDTPAGGSPASRPCSKGLGKGKAPVGFPELWPGPTSNIAQRPEAAGEAPPMIHKKPELGRDFTKSSHRAWSPTPAPPSPLCLGQGAQQGQDRVSPPGGGSACCHIQLCAVPGTGSPPFPGTPISLLPSERGWDIAAVLASSGPRGSFLSLIDCTLLRACLTEVLPFPRSSLLLPVFPSVAGAGGSSAQPCQTLQTPISNFPLSGRLIIRLRASPSPRR